MSLKLRLSIAAAVIVAAFGIAVGVWAFTSTSKNAPTGQFTVGSEATSIELVPYDTTTGTAYPNFSSPWCQSDADFQPGESVGCLFSVKNLKTTTGIQYGFATTSFADVGGALASKIHVRAEQTTLTVANANKCRDNTLPVQGSYFASTLLSDLPRTLANSTLAVGATSYICLRLTYDVTPAIFNASTSAVFRIDATDAP